MRYKESNEKRGILLAVVHEHFLAPVGNLHYRL